MLISLSPRFLLARSWPSPPRRLTFFPRSILSHSLNKNSCTFIFSRSFEQSADLKYYTYFLSLCTVYLLISVKCLCCLAICLLPTLLTINLPARRFISRKSFTSQLQVIFPRVKRLWDNYLLVCFPFNTKYIAIYLVCKKIMQISLIADFKLYTNNVQANYTDLIKRISIFKTRGIAYISVENYLTIDWYLFI